MAAKANTSDKEIERLCLAGLLKYPAFYWDIEGIKGVGREAFVTFEHQMVYDVIVSMIKAREDINPFLVAAKIKNLNISFGAQFNSYEFLEALDMMPINEEGLKAFFQELGTLTFKRGLVETAKKIQKIAEEPGNRKPSEILVSVDAVYGEINEFVDYGHGPIDVFDNLEDEIEGRNDEDEVVGTMPFPYPEFTDAYGNLKPGLYVPCARPNVGKSPFSLYTALASATGLHGDRSMFRAHFPLNEEGEEQWMDRISDLLASYDLDEMKHILYKDTEMEFQEVAPRLMATISHVDPAYFDKYEGRSWKEYPKIARRVRHLWPLVKKLKGKFHYENVKNIKTDEVIPMIKRWKMKTVGRDAECICVYDYLKITGESSSEHNKEYQIIGDKVSKLKDLSGDLRMPLFVPIQNNRMGIVNKGGKNQMALYNSSDDASVVAMSDRVIWFATWAGIFRRKSRAELATFGPEFGQYSLVPLKARFKGLNKKGFKEEIEMPDGQYAQNFFNLDFDLGTYTEKGTLQTIVNTGKLKEDVLEDDDEMP